MPAFTRNWLTAQGRAPVPPAAGLIDRVAMGVLHAGLLLWVFLPDARLAGVVLLAGGAMHLWRLAGWRGLAVVREPLLLILHAGYLWLVVGIALLGLSLLSGAVPPAAGIHALTSGAFGSMILAVMTRATLGHTGRVLHANGATVAIYLLVTLAALLRVVAAWPGAAAMDLLGVAAAAWIAAFGTVHRAVRADAAWAACRLNWARVHRRLCLPRCLLKEGASSLGQQTTR